jgi:hypothetical protein
MSVTVLDREMYTEAAAARLLGVAQGTLNYWLEGGARRGKVYPPDQALPSGPAGQES